MSHGPKKALTHLLKNRKQCAALHALALVVETIGTFLIYLDTARIDGLAHAAGHASATGENPLQYQHWYYENAKLGVAFMLFGILAQGFLVWFEFREAQKASEAIQ
jgi:hypothetical protein